MYNTAVIRKLLTEAFDDEDMRTLCSDYFPAVYQQFAAGMTKGQMIRLLLDHCERRRAMATLLNLVQQERPQLCAEYVDRVVSPSQRPPRIVHSLLPAPDFQTRPELDAVRNWWRDETQRGVLALVGVGGAGKTAIAHRFLAELPCTPVLPGWLKRQDLPSPDALFVWSFYDSPNVEDFSTELLSYLTDQEPSSSSRRGTLFQVQEVVERTVGRVLLVLDGLESMQEETKGSTFGTLRDMPMKQFVRRLADGIGETRAVITSRFPLTDLINYRCAWYKCEDVDLLEAKTARTLLRTRGVQGSDQELDALIGEFGAHAQTLDHLATLLVKFCGGIPSRARELPPLEEARGDTETELQARRLGRIFQFYEQQLPTEQVTILQHLAVFHKSVNLSTLLEVILRSLQKSEETVVSKLNAQGLREVIYRLRDLRLVYMERAADGSELVVIHPMIRNHFHRSLGSEATQVSESIRRPLFWHVLDLEEELLCQSLQAGRIQEAFDIYWHRMGSWDYLGLMLGAYTRGEAILSSFVSGDDPSLVPEGLTEEDQRNFINARGLFLMALGRLTDAVACFERRLELAKQAHNELVAAAALCNETDALVRLGRLKDARSTAEEALAQAEKVLVGERYRTSLSWCSYVSGLMGDTDAALSGFSRFWVLLFAALGEEAPVSKIESVQEAEIWLRLGQLEKAGVIARGSKEACEQENEMLRLSKCNLVLAEIARLQKDLQQAEELVEQALEWSIETAEQEILSWGYLLQARLALQMNDLYKAGLVLRRGLDIAEEYGYGLYWIDLKTVEGQWRLHCGEAEATEDCVRVALAGWKQESGPYLLGAQNAECGYAWGEGDALHLLGQALLAQKRTDEARQALMQAVTIRQRICDPKVEQSRQLLQDVNH